LIALEKIPASFTIDINKRQLNLEIHAAEMKKRREGRKVPKPRSTPGLLAKYAARVSTASFGAVTDRSLELS